MITGGLLASLPLAVSAFDPDELYWEDTAAGIPHVLTPARLQQPTAEVPASVTVLDADFIARTGIKHISQLLRYVPGMLVAYDVLDNSDAVVYHGGPDMMPKSFQVLVDGRSVYRSGIASVGWDRLPVAVEDIQRIEVVRGPSAASYGTNAYQAVVNIITRLPQDTTHSVVSADAGDNTEERIFASTFGGSATNQWRLSANYQRTDHLRDSTRSSLGCSEAEPCSDQRMSSFISLRTNHELAPDQSVDTSLMASYAQRDVPRYEFTDNEVGDRHVEAGARYHYDMSANHQLKVSAYSVRYARLQEASVDGYYAGFFDPELVRLDQLNPTAANEFAYYQTLTTLNTSDPEQASIGATLTDRYPNALSFYQPISGNLEANTVEYRHDFEVQDTFAPTQNLTLISGAGYRYEKVTSKQYYNGSIDANKLRIFGNINWNASKNWVLHTGAMFEQEEDYESLLSFKAAANYMFSPVESLRFVYSRAGRTPDFHEQFADWTYQLSDMETTSPYADTTYYDSFKGPGNLEHQTINAFEVGYFAQRQLFSGTAEWDIRIFREELTDVIHHFPSIHADTVYTGNQINYTGVEWQASLNPFAGTTLRVSGAMVDTDISTVEGLESHELISLYAPSVHSLAWLQEWPGRLNSTLSLFVVDDGCKVESDISGCDSQTLEMHIYRDTQAGETNLRLSLRGQHDFSDESLTANGEPYRTDTRIQAGLQLSF